MKWGPASSALRRLAMARTLQSRSSDCAGFIMPPRLLVTAVILIELADMIHVHGFADGNANAAARKYARRFLHRRHPDRRSFERGFVRLRETGTVASLSPAEREGQTTQNEARILEIVDQDPTVSTWQVAQQVCSVCGTSAKIGGWESNPNTQYHIQTDEGPERYFKYQTVSGQYRKEKRLQDGTVVGSYGWVDANGILRLRDYIADDKGYRIVRTKTINVGDMPIDNAISLAKKTPANSAAESASYQPKPTPVSLDTYLKEKQYSTPAPISYDEYVKQKNYGTTPKPISLSDYLKEKQLATASPVSDYTPNVEVNINGYPSTTPAPSTTVSSTTEAPYSSTPAYVRPVTFRPYFNFNSLSSGKKYENVRYETANSDYVPQYDGVSMTPNGFRYYLPRHYHEETNLPGQQRAGSFGYIDPFGIRRVIYYNTSPGSGFIHRKNNRYVGFRATPYDPRF